MQGLLKLRLSGLQWNHRPLPALGPDVDMRSRAVRRLAMQSALHRALEREEFHVVYQPTVCLPTGRSEGVEALVRWDRPDHGIVRPADFVPLAEGTGLIVPLVASNRGPAVTVAASTRQLHGASRAKVTVPRARPPGGTGKTAPREPEPSGVKRARPTRGA